MAFRGGKAIWVMAAVVTVSGTGVAAGLTPGSDSDATVRTATATESSADAAEPTGIRGVDPWAEGIPFDLVSDEAPADEPAEPTSSPGEATAAAAPSTPSAPAPAAPPPPPPTTTTTPPPPPPAPAAAPAPPPPPPPPPSGPTAGTRNTSCEQYMAQRINQARAAVGRGALAFDTGIQYIAVDWSDEMAGSQTLKHNPNYANQILRHRDYRSAGENVGRGFDQATLFQAFMDSPGHRANIESGSYSHVTVGCLTDANGQLWVTQNFWG